MEIKDVFGDLPTLETDRLWLRKINQGDAQDLFDYASDAEVAKYTTWSAHQTLQDSRDFLQSVMEQYAMQTVASWGIVHKGNSKFIGTCGFISWSPHHARAEVAYALSRKYWGQGLMPEAVRAVIAFGFRTMQLNRVQAICEIENVASARVMEKVGMTFEGMLRGYMFFKERYRNLKMYSVLREEWDARVSQLQHTPQKICPSTRPISWVRFERNIEWKNKINLKNLTWVRIGPTGGGVSPTS